MTLKELVHGWQGNLLQLTLVLFIPKPGILPALGHISLSAPPILSTHIHCTHSFLFPGVPHLSRLHRESPRESPIGKTYYWPIASYLLLPPIQAPQRCFVLPAASGHPSGPAPECGGVDGQEQSEHPLLTPWSNPRTLDTLCPLLSSTKYSPLSPRLSGVPPQARPAYLL